MIWKQTEVVRRKYHQSALNYSAPKIRSLLILNVSNFENHGSWKGPTRRHNKPHDKIQNYGRYVTVRLLKRSFRYFALGNRKRENLTFPEI